MTLFSVLMLNCIVLCSVDVAYSIIGFCSCSGIFGLCHELGVLLSPSSFPCFSLLFFFFC